MIDNVIFRSIALNEIEEAYRWYETQREGLGDDFILCMEESLGKIARNPEIYPIIHKNIRRSLIRRFPYGILYFTEEEKIVVVGIFHSSRNPKKWENRA